MLKTRALGFMFLAFAASVIPASAQTLKPGFDPSKRTESPCGVKESFDEVMENIKIEWRQVSEARGHKYYYNTRKMRCSEDGVLAFWVKNIEAKHSPKDPAFTLLREEAKCKADKWRITSGTSYNEDGGVIDSSSPQERAWEDVTPDSVEQRIFDAVCKRGQ
jgi:hypothetical protein